MLPVPTFRITSAAVARLARYGGRMELTHFNDLPEAEAIEVVSVWARVPAWAEAVAGTRPFASVDELEATADRLARSWGRPELDAALAHHFGCVHV